ncbi:MAG: hypothetical protein ACLRSR_04190 [[Ruminococcus] lactaris]
MKRGKIYRSCETDRKRKSHDPAEAVALVKNQQQQNLMRQSKLISEQVVTDVTQISRSVVL